MLVVGPKWIQDQDPLRLVVVVSGRILFGSVQNFVAAYERKGVSAAP